MQKLLTIILVVPLLVFISCSKEEKEVVAPNVGYSYAGLDLGRYIIYNVDSHHYNLPFNVDTIVQFQIKEVVEEKYSDLEGEEAYKIVRYRKDSTNGSWLIQDVWNAKLTASNYQKVEEDVRFVKLIFPVGLNKTWNGNLMNTIDTENYEYTSVHQQAIVGAIGFDSVTTVLQFEDINLVQERYFEEKFAAGVGLVYKKSINVNNAYNSSVGLWLPDVGEDVTMTVEGYN